MLLSFHFRVWHNYSRTSRTWTFTPEPDHSTVLYSILTNSQNHWNCCTSIFMLYPNLRPTNSLFTFRIICIKTTYDEILLCIMNILLSLITEITGIICQPAWHNKTAPYQQTFRYNFSRYEERHVKSYIFAKNRGIYAIITKYFLKNNLIKKYYWSHIGLCFNRISITQKSSWLIWTKFLGQKTWASDQSISFLTTPIRR